MSDEGVLQKRAFGGKYDHAACIDQNLLFKLRRRTAVVLIS